MNSIFNKLGDIAQNALNTSLPGASQNATSGTAHNTASGTSAGDALGTLFGTLKENVPNGVGGLLGAGALGGILGALLSGSGVSKSARKLGKGALMVGGTAVAAGFAWKLYQKWAGQSAQAEPGNVLSGTSETGVRSAPPSATGTFGAPGALDTSPSAAPELVQTAHDPAALLVLEAMVFSARADGHMDKAERNAVYATMAQLFPHTDVAVNIDALLNCPLDPERLAQQVVNAEQARDLYRLSRLVIVADHSMELAYLAALARALHIDQGEQDALDQEVAALQAGAA